MAPRSGYAPANHPITKSLFLKPELVICMLLCACGRMPAGEDLAQGPSKLSLGGSDCVIQLEWVEGGPRARVELDLRWRVRDCGELPSTLRLVADMPQMSHGPTEIEMWRNGELYEGSILFVMGGRWELRLYDGDDALLTGWLDVAER